MPLGNFLISHVVVLKNHVMCAGLRQVPLGAEWGGSTLIRPLSLCRETSSLMRSIPIGAIARITLALIMDAALQSSKTPVCLVAGMDGNFLSKENAWSG